MLTTAAIVLLVFEVLYRTGILDCGVSYHWRVARAAQAAARANMPPPPRIPWGDRLTLFVVVGGPIIFVVLGGWPFF
jgi:hypothetical protein